jgi:hypothetical protein
MRWTILAMALAAVIAVGSGAGAQTPAMTDKDKMMEKDKMMDKSSAMPDKMDAGKMEKGAMEKDKMMDKGMMQGKDGMKDSMMEKKP